MNIITPYFIIESPINGKSILSQIEKAGRTAYKSEDKITNASAKEFVSLINSKGHHSVIEHQSITVRVVCDRGVSHEIVRHRIASYTQESTRYCNYAQGKFGNELTVIKPCFWDENDEKYLVWKNSIIQSEKAYNELIALGASPQEARSVLPNSLKTEIVITMNLREWKHFFELRTSDAAHPQMREIARPLLKEFQKRIPIIFDDLKEIMVIKRNTLLSSFSFYGFSEQNKIDFTSIINHNHEWLMREAAENNCSYKQPICYAVIYNSTINKIFVYQRSKKTPNYYEKRLQGKYSCGIGGHIERSDLSESNPIITSLTREIKEEIGIEVEYDTIKVIGYINNDDEVGLGSFWHFLYVINTEITEIIPPR